MDNRKVRFNGQEQESFEKNLDLKPQEIIKPSDIKEDTKFFQPLPIQESSQIIIQDETHERFQKLQQKQKEKKMEYEEKNEKEKEKVKINLTYYQKKNQYMKGLQRVEQFVQNSDQKKKLEQQLDLNYHKLRVCQSKEDSWKRLLFRKAERLMVQKDSSQELEPGLKNNYIIERAITFLPQRNKNSYKNKDLANNKWNEMTNASKKSVKCIITPNVLKYDDISATTISNKIVKQQKEYNNYLMNIAAKRELERGKLREMRSDRDEFLYSKCNMNSVPQQKQYLFKPVSSYPNERSISLMHIPFNQFLNTTESHFRIKNFLIQNQSNYPQFQPQSCNNVLQNSSFYNSYGSNISLEDLNKSYQHILKTKGENSLKSKINQIVNMKNSNSFEKRANLSLLELNINSFNKQAPLCQKGSKLVDKNYDISKFPISQSHLSPQSFDSQLGKSELNQTKFKTSTYNNISMHNQLLLDKQQLDQENLKQLQDQQSAYLEITKKQSEANFRLSQPKTSFKPANIMNFSDFRGLFVNEVDFNRIHHPENFMIDTIVNNSKFVQNNIQGISQKDKIKMTSSPNTTQNIKQHSQSYISQNIINDVSQIKKNQDENRNQDCSIISSYNQSNKSFAQMVYERECAKQQKQLYDKNYIQIKIRKNLMNELDQFIQINKANQKDSKLYPNYRKQLDIDPNLLKRQ